MQSYGLTNSIDQHSSICYNSTFLKIYCVAGPNSPKILINKLFEIVKNLNGQKQKYLFWNTEPLLHLASLTVHSRTKGRFVDNIVMAMLA